MVGSGLFLGRVSTANTKMELQIMLRFEMIYKDEKEFDDSELET